ncbi:MAG: hypothetical protein B7Z80_12205 [Rhodospirillales bacterium 20-64-7]|nr:MAG: hypothetical protein B7Z80_12205 [Rhodospirillales bacterium 20-64-7]
MPTESKSQQATIARVMHEEKHGELKTSTGKKVTSRKQAMAIALREAGATNTETNAENARNLERTKRKERAGETAQDEAEGKH